LLKKGKPEIVLQSADNRSQAIVQRKFQDIANSIRQVSAGRNVQLMENSAKATFIQRVEEEETLQGKFETAQRVTDLEVELPI
jgi:hypothetical protein